MWVSRKPERTEICDAVKRVSWTEHYSDRLPVWISESSDGLEAIENVW